MIAFPIHYPLCCACFKPARNIGADFPLIYARRVLCQTCTSDGLKFTDDGAVVRREVAQ